MIRKILGAALLTVCSLLLILFLLNMLGGICNPGNIIGAIFCLSVIFLYLLYPGFQKKRSFRIAGRVLCGFFSAAGIYCAVVSVCMIAGMTKTPERAAEAGTFHTGEPQTVIILGCQTIGGQPSAMLRARLDRAIAYLNENPSAVCIPTGGQGSDETEPEGVTMCRYLTENGISESRIYVEDQAVNTRENIAHAKTIMEKYELPEQVVIVSELYHVYRGLRIAKRCGLEASALPAASAETWFALPSYWAREILALTLDFFAAQT